MSGKTVCINATTLEANAALRSIVRRDTGAAHETFLRGLAAASGIPTPTRAELARLDRKRPKKGSNDDWTHPQDPDARITKMNDGRTHPAHKAEQAVDLETGAVVGFTVQDAAAGDTETMVETLLTAAERLDQALPAAHGRILRHKESTDAYGMGSVRHWPSRQPPSLRQRVHSRERRFTGAGRCLPSQKYSALNRSICLSRSISVRSCRTGATLRTSAFASVSVNRSTK